MEYYLYPPFFLVEPQTSFSSAWEDFCRLLLNLDKRTTTIHRRMPPDRGVDLFWKDEKIAYQCKAVESGPAGKLRMDHIRKSIREALEYQGRIGWRKYILCTNVTPTGLQVEKLQQMLPEIEILPCGYWTDLCQQFHEQIANRFRLLIPVASIHVHQAVQAINHTYSQAYLPQAQEVMQGPTLNALLYSNKHKHIFDIPIPVTLTINEILLMLRELLELPGPKYMREQNTIVSLEYSLHINNKEVPLQQRLQDLNAGNRPLITLLTTICWSDSGHTTQALVLEGLSHSLETHSRGNRTSPYGPAKLAVERYAQEIERAIDQAAARFSQ